MSKDVSYGLGFGYETPEGKLCMIRCFSCGRENYAMAVSSGCCAFCGHDANSNQPVPKKKKPKTVKS